MYRVGTAWVPAALPAASKQRETARICMKRRYSRRTWTGEETQRAMLPFCTVSSAGSPNAASEARVRVIEGGALVK